MAWNEPGGGDQGDKDPWGNRDKDGPPDLDEAFRKLQANLSQMFGGGSGSNSSGGGGSKSISMGMIGARGNLWRHGRLYGGPAGAWCCAAFWQEAG